MEGFKHASTGRLGSTGSEPRQGEIKAVMASMEVDRLRVENEGLRQQNQVLGISQRENVLLKARVEEWQAKSRGKDALDVENIRLNAEIVELRSKIQRKDEKIQGLEEEVRNSHGFREQDKSRTQFQNQLMAKMGEQREEIVVLQTKLVNHSILTKENDELKREVARVTGVLNDMRRQRTEGLLNSSLADELKLYQAHVEEENRLLKRRLEEMSRREHEYFDKKEFEVKLEERLRQIVEAKESAELLVNQLKQENGDLKRKVHALDTYEQHVRKLVEENKRLSDVLIGLKNQVQPDPSVEKSRLIQDQERVIEQLKSELVRQERVASEWESRLKSMERSYNGKVMEASQLGVALAENERLCRLVDQLGSEGEAIRNEFLQKELKYKGAVDREALVREGLEKRVFDVENMNSSLVKKVEQLMYENSQKTTDGAEIEERGLRIRGLEERLRIAEGERDTLKNIDRNNRMERDKDFEELKKMKNEVDGLKRKQSELEEVRQAEYRAVEKVAGLEGEIKKLKTCVANKEFELENLGREMARKQDELKLADGIKVELDRYRSQYLEEVEKSKKAVQLDSNLQLLISENHRLQEIVSSMQARLAEEESSQRRLKQTVESLKRELEIVDKLKIEKSALIENEANLKARINQLLIEIKANTQLGADVYKVDDQNKRLSHEIQVVQEENKVLRGEVSDWKRQGDYWAGEKREKEAVERTLAIKEKELLEAMGTVRRLELKGERIRELEERVHVLLQEGKEEEATRARLEGMVGSLQERLWRAEEEGGKRAALEGRLGLMAGELEAVQGKLGKLQEVLQGVRAERDEGAARERALQGEVGRLEGEVAVGQERARKLQGTVDGLREELGLARNLEKQARQLVKEGEGVRSRLESIKVKEGAVEELSLQCENYEKSLANLAEDNKNLKFRVQEVVRLLEAMKELNEDLERENKSIPRLEGQIRLLESLVEERDRKIEEGVMEREAIIEETDAIIERQRSEAAEVVRQYKGLEAEYSSLKCDKNESDYQNISLMKRLEMMKEESGMMSGDLIDQKKMSNEIVMLRETSHEQKMELDKSQMKLDEAERELSILRKKLNESFRELNKVTELSGQLIEVKDQLELANIQNKTHQKTVEELRKIIEEKEQAEYSETLNTRIADRLQIELSERDSHITGLEKERDRLHFDRKALEKRAQELQQVLDEERNQSTLVGKNSVQKVKSLKEKVETLERELREKYFEVETQKREIDGLNNRLREASLKEKGNKATEKRDSVSRVEESNSEEGYASREHRPPVETDIERENRLLKGELSKVARERDHLQTRADEQVYDARNKSVDISNLKTKLVVCLSELERLNIQ
jgi:chromosome segregation ATPase